MLHEITPVILTFNEEANIARTLARLGWAREVVVVDSGSSDQTAEIASGFRNVRVVTRPFDTHAAQWNFAVHETGIATEWVLALDADYQVTDELTKELRELRPVPDVDGYIVRCDYAIYGTTLPGSAYPPVTALFRRTRGSYRQDGHTQRLHVAGRCVPLAGKIVHDDRKPLEQWFVSQVRYAAEERGKLVQARSARRRLSLFDRIRLKTVFAPFLMAAYCLVARGNILSGRKGLFYTFQRVTAELLLSLLLMEQDLVGRDEPHHPSNV